MNEVIRSLKERRSVRAYRPEQISEEQLQAILEAGTYAPSGMGKQSAIMVVVQDKETIAKVWNDHHYLCDTHTATAWAVAEDYVAQTGDDSPMVVLSTASAYKFPEAVLSSLEQTLPEDDFACIDRLWELTGVPVPENLKGLQQKKVLHPGVIEKEEMLSYVTAL